MKYVREGEISYDILQMWNLKRNELMYKTEADSQTLRMSLWFLGGKKWEKGTVREFGMDMYRALYLK